MIFQAPIFKKEIAVGAVIEKYEMELQAYLVVTDILTWPIIIEFFFYQF